MNLKIGLSLFGCAEKYTLRTAHSAVEYVWHAVGKSLTFGRENGLFEAKKIGINITINNEPNGEEASVLLSHKDYAR